MLEEVVGSYLGYVGEEEYDADFDKDFFRDRRGWLKHYANMLFDRLHIKNYEEDQYMDKGFFKQFKKGVRTLFDQLYTDIKNGDIAQDVLLGKYFEMWHALTEPIQAMAWGRPVSIEVPDIESGGTKLYEICSIEDIETLLKTEEIDSDYIIDKCGSRSQKIKKALTNLIPGLSPFSMSVEELETLLVRWSYPREGFINILTAHGFANDLVWYIDVVINNPEFLDNPKEYVNDDNLLSLRHDVSILPPDKDE